jgi:hypothetical protein
MVCLDDKYFGQVYNRILHKFKQASCLFGRGKWAKQGSSIDAEVLAQRIN